MDRKQPPKQPQKLQEKLNRPLHRQRGRPRTSPPIRDTEELKALLGCSKAQLAAELERRGIDYHKDSAGNFWAALEGLPPALEALPPALEAPPPALDVRPTAQDGSGSPKADRHGGEAGDKV